jgi:hypothetical protein
MEMKITDQIDKIMPGPMWHGPWKGTVVTLYQTETDQDQH